MDNNKNPFWQKEDNENNSIDDSVNNESNNDTANNTINDSVNETNDETKNNTIEQTQDKTQDNIEESNQTQESEENSNYKAQLEDLNNKYIRLAADFDNYRKRTLQEKEELSKFACADLLKKIATVLDTFDRAEEHLKNIEDCKVVKDSYDVAYKQLLETLKKAGMEEIECIGKEFNPSEHEAIAQVPTDEFEPDSIAYVAQKGYKLGDRIIRPALVGVAKKKEDE